MAVNYQKYINSFKNPDCTAALNRIYPKIDLDKICKIIDHTEGLSDIRRNFYKTMIRERYIHILKRAYEQSVSLDEQNLNVADIERD